MLTKVRSLLLSALCLIALAVCQLVVRAQGSSEEWQTCQCPGIPKRKKVRKRITA